MAIALIAVLLIEVLLLVLWAPFFFRTGIVLFNQRIAATPAELAQLSLAGLEHDLPADTWLRLVFRALPDGSVAFCESFTPSFGGRYFPLMRGRVKIDARRRGIRVDQGRHLPERCVGVRRSRRARPGASLSVPARPRWQRRCARARRAAGAATAPGRAG
jgi:hypothetical protein